MKLIENKNLVQKKNGKKTIVFLHYFGGSAKSWQWVVSKLSNSYNCITIDFPGFGNTAALDSPSIQGFAEFVQKKLDEAGIKSYTLVGHSMGGKIAMQIASNAEKWTVKQLILIAPSPPTTEPMPREEKERMLHHPDRKEAEETVEHGIKQKLEPEKFNLAVASQLLVDHETWKWWLEKGMKHSIAERITLKMPITVFASEDDPVITPEIIQERVIKELKGANLINTKGVGHLIPLEAPDWIANQIRTVLEKSPT